MSAVRSVTEVARHFLEYVDRVASRRERLVLVRDDQQPVAELRPVHMAVRAQDLPTLFASLPHLDPADVAHFAEDIQQGRTELSRRPIRDHWND